MKITFTFLAILLSAINSNSQWQSVSRITQGYTDRNPAFGIQPGWNQSFFLYELMAFTRIVGPYPRVYVMKFGPNGPLDAGTEITTNSVINDNPTIAYRTGSMGTSYNITKAMVVWITNINSYLDIYGSLYNGTSWSSPFPVVVTTEYKSNPRITCIDTNHFAIVYQTMLGEIYFKRYLNGTWLADTNLTDTEPQPCSNPYISVSYSSSTYSLIVSYEKNISSSQRHVLFRKRNYNTQWTSPDTIAIAGYNKNSGFVPYVGGGTIYCLFESNRSGKWTVYSTQVNFFSSSLTQDLVVNDPSARNTNFAASNIPILVDDPVNFYSVANAYVKRRNDSTRVWGSYGPLYYNGDTNSIVQLTVGRGVYLSPGTLSYWLVFTKDTLGTLSNLYAARTIVSLGGVHKISSEIPEQFSLSQNYPNPFNPNSKIEFQILKLSDTKLVVFDVLGKEIATLVNEQLKPGTYEVDFDGTNFPSGVYFYSIQIITDDLVQKNQTKKMVLIK